jgi:hypothetical protein
VVTDGRLVIGLHQRAGPTPVLTFVRAGVAGALPAFANAGIELTVCRTGDEVFNEVGFADPFGHAVAVLEARTYSPTDRRETQASLCGDFAEVSLPAGDFAAAQTFWEPLGFVAAAEEEPYSRLSLTSDHLDITFHRPRLHLQPMLVFREPGMAARIARLREQGFEMGAALAGSQNPAAFLESPDGTTLLLLAGEE